MRMREFGRRLSVLFRRGRFERDLEEEMRFHFELQAEETKRGYPSFSISHIYPIHVCASMGGAGREFRADHQTPVPRVTSRVTA